MASREQELSSKHDGYGLHPAGPFCERVDNEILVFRSPPPHLPVGANNRIDIVGNILILSEFVMERRAVDCQGLENVSDVHLWTASDAKM